MTGPSSSEATVGRRRPDDTAAYGRVARLLHWSTVGLLTAQFAVGYGLDRSDWLEDLGEAWLGDASRLLVVHIGLGVTILVVAGARVAWRRAVGLPPWAPTLSAVERRVASLTEKALYVLLFAIPLTGLALVLVSGEDWDVGRGEWVAPREWVDDDVLLGAHIASHLAFFLAVGTHVGLVLKHQLLDRDHLLRRML